MEFLLICQFEMIIIKLSTIDKIEMANNIKGDSKKSNAKVLKLDSGTENSTSCCANFRYAYLI
jgi:hypothetical protein